MLCTSFGILVRIVSNSYLNVFQKLLTQNGENPEVINFNTYLGLSIIGLCFCSFSFEYSSVLLVNILVMGLLGALGNLFIIKALSIGELSVLAPINSYKPVVALIIGFLYLKEIPSVNSIFGIALIIIGTYFILDLKKGADFNLKAIFYRILALIFSGSEAIFIKKVITLIGVLDAFFVWAFAGLVFSAILLLLVNQNIKLKLKRTSLKYQCLLVASVGIMQYSTNYVFSKMNVAYALALFQLSTILSIFLGVNIFSETNLKKKLFGAFLMVIGACVLILIS